MADGSEGLGAKSDGLLGSGGADGEVAHLSSRSGLGFAVKVQHPAGEGENRGPVRFALGPKVAEQVEHGGGAERGNQPKGQAANGANLLLKLAGVAGLHGEVA